MLGTQKRIRQGPPFPGALWSREENRALQLGVMRTMLREEQDAVGAQEGDTSASVGSQEGLLEKIILTLEAVD